MIPVRFLLDTNICIYIARRHPPEVASRFERLRPGDVGMSMITYGELLVGARRRASSRNAPKSDCRASASLSRCWRCRMSARATCHPRDESTAYWADPPRQVHGSGP